MVFISGPLKKPDYSDMNPQRIMKILKLLERDEYAEMNMRDEIARLRNEVAKKIKALVSSRTDGDMHNYRVTFRGMTPNDYLDNVPRYLMDFQNGNPNQFNLQSMLSGVAYEELASRDGRNMGFYKSVKDELTEMFRLMQAMRILRNSEVSEVRELYQKLLATYN